MDGSSGCACPLLANWFVHMCIYCVSFVAGHASYQGGLEIPCTAWHSPGVKQYSNNNKVYLNISFVTRTLFTPKYRPASENSFLYILLMLLQSK